MNLKLLLKVCKALSAKPDHTKPRLITVGFSHFCEKARWGLDLSPLAHQYYEEVHCPAMHLSSTLALTNNTRILTWDSKSDFHQLLNQRHNAKLSIRKDKTSVPKLILPNDYMQKYSSLRPWSDINNFNKDNNLQGLVVGGGSSGILRMLSDLYPESKVGTLYPTGDIGKQVIELEHYLDTHLGPAVTDYCFVNLLLIGQDLDPTDTINSDVNTNMVKSFLYNNTNLDVPYIEKVILKLFGMKYLIPLMCKANNINSSITQNAITNIHQIFQKMDDLLIKYNTNIHNNTFLLGTDYITAADITFAALAAPLLLPNQTELLFNSKSNLYENSLKPKYEGGKNLLNLSNELGSKYKSAQYVLDLYKNHRFIVTSPDIVIHTIDTPEKGLAQQKVIIRTL